MITQNSRLRIRSNTFFFSKENEQFTNFRFLKKVDAIFQLFRRIKTKSMQEKNVEEDKKKIKSQFQNQNYYWFPKPNVFLVLK